MHRLGRRFIRLVASVALGTGSFVGAASAAARSSPADEPPLEFDQEERVLEIGFHPRRYWVDFVFRVVGDAPVTIRNFSTSCPCTTISLDRTTYYPGQKGIVAAVYDYRGDAEPVVQVLEVHTDRSRRPKLLRIVPRRTEKPLWVERAELRWVALPAAGTQTVDIEVPPRWLTRTPAVAVSAPGWNVVLEPIEPAGAYRLRITPETERPAAAQVRLSLAAEEGDPSAPAVSANISLVPPTDEPR